MGRLESDDTPSVTRRDVTAFFSPQDCVNFLRFTQSQRREEISMRPPAERAFGDDSGKQRRSGRVSSLSGGSSTSDGQDDSSEPLPPDREPQEVDASDEGSTITTCNSDAGEDKHDTRSIDVPPKVELFKCFHHRRWAATLPLQVPDPGYLEDDVPLTFVDSTAELLEKSQPRRFPAFVGAASQPKASYARQEGMYQRWKKVMVRGRRAGAVGEEEVVFRATDEEVRDAVEEVAEGTLSLEGYLAEVKRIRNRQQLGTGH